MGAFFAFAVKAAICLIVYYLFYKLLFSKETFHRFNRIALVTLMLLSFVLPFIHLSNPDAVHGAIDIEDLVAVGYSANVADEVTQIPLSTRLISLAMIVYFVGIAVMIVRSIIIYVSLAKALHQGRIVESSLYALPRKINLVVQNKSMSPFSWLNYIVVSEKDLNEAAESILAHEMGHINNRHTLDLIFTELCLVFQWFNPAMWLMRQELQAIHEYEADEAVLDYGVNAKQYQLLIIKKAAGSRLQSITNSLHQSSIKNRITMMLKQKSNPWAKAKYLLAVPVATFSMVMFATPTATTLSEEFAGCKVSNLFPNEQTVPEKMSSNDEEEALTVCEIQPEYPGGGQELMKFIQENLRYPKECVDNNIEGRVVLSFIVEKDGSVTNFEEMKSPNQLLTDESIRVLSMMPKWIPGKQDEKDVRVKYVIPITFSLKGGDKSQEVVSVKTSSSNPTINGFNGIVIVNDKVYPSEELSKISPSEIESIEVFKGESYSTAEERFPIVKQYLDAKNGVIVIKLKK